jgi:hypothetical protein
MESPFLELYENITHSQGGCLWLWCWQVADNDLRDSGLIPCASIKLQVVLPQNCQLPALIVGRRKPRIGGLYLMDRGNINVEKLTKEAEAGHGHFVRAVLDEISFQDRLKVLRQVQALSKEHNRQNVENPYLEVRAGVDSDVGCAYVVLNRHVPHKQLFGLLDKATLLYGDWIKFPTGEENISDSDLFE